jgi:hypothetical protein
MLLHITKYKNIGITSLLSTGIGLLALAIIYMLVKTTINISLGFGIISACLVFIWIGRQIIVRHRILSNNTIQVDFLLRPDYKLEFTKDEIEELRFKVIDRRRFGVYQKGILIFKNEKNYHADYLTLKFGDEVKWFWANFEYPNMKKNSS